MKSRVIGLLAIVPLLCGSRTVAAQTLALTTGSTGTLLISTATAGADPSSANTAAGTYTVTQKKRDGALRITARLNAAMPAGTTLRITLAAPAGATSMGAVILTTTAQNVVTGIPAANVTTPAAAISYTFTATPAAGVIGPSSRIVTLTVGP